MNFASFIPPEVWLISLSLLEPHDLTRFVLVSSTFLILGRPLLYQSVFLNHSKDAVKYTVDLLKRDRILSRNVRLLELITSVYGASHKPWFDVDILASMPHLHTLTLRGFPYRLAEMQQSFLDTLSESCHDLKEFTYDRVIASDISSTIDWSILSKLKRLTWDGAVWSVGSSVLALLHTNRSSLTYISLPASGNVNEEALETFCQLKFPNLISLELGPFIDSDSDTVPEIITSFLINHPGIESLILHFTLDDEWSIDLCESSLAVDMLPNLISLHTRANNIALLAFVGVGFLKNLSNLYVGHGLSENAETDINDMFFALEEYGGLPALTELQFEPGESLDEHEEAAKYWMAEFVKTCPNLRRFTGTLPMMEVDTLASIFASFGELTHLDLTQDDLDIGHFAATGGGELLVSSCRRLEEMIIRWGRGNSRRVRVKDGEIIDVE